MSLSDILGYCACRSPSRGHRLGVHDCLRPIEKGGWTARTKSGGSGTEAETLICYDTGVEIVVAVSTIVGLGNVTASGDASNHPGCVGSLDLRGVHFCHPCLSRVTYAPSPSELGAMAIAGLMQGA